MSKPKTATVAPSAPPPALAIPAVTDTSDVPMPPDGMALAHWCGIKTKSLWYFILNRSKLYKTHRIPKPKGGVRLLHEPEQRLKFAQRMFLDRVLSKFPSYDHIGAYTDARGVRYTATRHAGHSVILELDIKDFFGSTTRKYVRDFFRGIGWTNVSAKLAADLLTYPIKPDLSIVPQGAPSSPQICNLIGHARFDQKILSYLSGVDPQWLYTRYSDNIIVSHPTTRTKDEVDAVLNNVRGIIQGAGYRVHPKKLKVMRSTHPKKPQRLLGLTVNAMPNIPVEEYRRLRAQIHTAKISGFKAVTGVPENSGVIPHLDGRLNYYLHINPASPKLRRLKSEFDAIKLAHETQPQNLAAP